MDSPAALYLLCFLLHWRYKMLGQTSGVEEAGTLRWELFLILILAWILIYLCIFKGVKSTGKVGEKSENCRQRWVNKHQVFILCLYEGGVLYCPVPVCHSDRPARQQCAASWCIRWDILLHCARMGQAALSGGKTREKEVKLNWCSCSCLMGWLVLLCRCGWTLQRRSSTPLGLVSVPSWPCPATTPSTTMFWSKHPLILIQSSSYMSAVITITGVVGKQCKEHLFSLQGHPVHIHYQLSDQHPGRLRHFLCLRIHVLPSGHSCQPTGSGWWDNSNLVFNAFVMV